MAYLNVDEVESALVSLARAYPSLCERIPLPNRSCEGRTISALRIGKLPADQGDVLLVTGSHHAREWGGADICVSFAADLLEAYSRKTGLVYGGKSYTKADVARVVEGIQTVVLPDVNPDGRAYSQTTDKMWRRNRNRSYGGGNTSCEGVDLNRNYDFLWDYKRHFHPKADVGTSDNPCDPQQTWRGPSPLSEPETRNVDWLLKRFPRMKWYVDLHSYGELILYPWGNDESQSDHPEQNFQNAAYDGKRGLPNDALYREYVMASDNLLHQSLARSMATAVKAVRGKTYTPQPGFDLYPTSGCSDDYAYSLHRVNPKLPKIHAFTIEWGTRFQPSWNEMSKIIGDISAALVCLALEGPRRSGNTLVTLTTPQLALAKGATGTVEFLVETMRPLNIVADPPPGYSVKTVNVGGGAGRTKARATVHSSTGLGGKLHFHCPETGQEWEVVLKGADVHP